MKAYWITYKDGTGVCCEGYTADDAGRIAKHIQLNHTVVAAWSEVVSINELPYPAYPAVWQFDHPIHGKTPRFCHSPAGCQGKTACPRDPSCTS